MTNFNPSDFSILIVDDAPKNLQVLAKILQTVHYKIDYATSGDKAVQWLKRKKFDLVLLDVVMPDMDGFEVCRVIRNDKNIHDTPVIFITALNNRNDIIEGFNVGGQDYIVKPFDPGELLVRVKTQLELKASKERLKEVNQWLEEKVEERTIQLQQANNLLEQQNRELFDLDNAKNEFLKIISHEIRTPLNGVLGFLDVIKLQFKNKKLLHYIQRIDGSTRRLERFLLLALQYTELKTRSRKLKPNNIEFYEFLNDIIKKQFGFTIDKKEIKLEIKLEPDEFTVYADNELLETCMISILDNAVRFTRTGGNICINASNRQDSKVIEITDEGPGFTEYALQNLFKPFSSKDHVNENEGLELALANLILSAHHGNLKAENLDKGGAKVTLYFPENVG
ncbi:MAG: hybrid sensor histidine kinase/response regulator [Bacteroidales bacterium]|nr:hybrid sensor histidine kinase/response regulator [Bacteroidales bacterium]